MFIVCVWTARYITLQNIKKDIFEETEFLRFSQKSQFSKTDYKFWKSYKASSEDQSMCLLDFDH